MAKHVSTAELQRLALNLRATDDPKRREELLKRAEVIRADRNEVVESSGLLRPTEGSSGHSADEEILPETKVSIDRSIRNR